MISYPALFFAISSVAVIAALVAIWNSLRVALGGGPGVVIETARDLPDHAALVEEKNSLLRAIKDLEYEHAVGKISDADHHRLDRAYRARAKQVLAQLDRDVKPLYAQAEKLVAEHVARGGLGGGAAKTRADASAADAAPPEQTTREPEAASTSEAAERAPSAADAVIEMIRTGQLSEMPDLPADLDDAERARVVAMLQQMLKKYETAGTSPPLAEKDDPSGEERSE